MLGRCELGARHGGVCTVQPCDVWLCWIGECIGVCKVQRNAGQILDLVAGAERVR